MKRFIFIVLILGVLGILFLGWCMFGDHSKFLAGLDQYEALPLKASDITVYQNSNITGNFVADFKISEPEFVSFAAESQWTLEPIACPEFVRQARSVYEGRPNDQKKVTDGLQYSQRRGNGGGVTIVYDRKDSRGYIDISAR